MSAGESVAGPGPRSWATRVRALWLDSNRVAPLLCASSVAAAALVLLPRLNHGWFENDDGSFAHEAERILQGELPHRDFAELYTGVLSFINAAIFASLGHEIVYLRIPLFVLFLAFAACYFALARRLVGPLGAFGATLFAITWSVPIYPAPMPSWYQLFLATFGIYAVVRYIETQRVTWLFAAGLLGGVSILVKVTGVWYVAAVFLLVLVRPLIESSGETPTRRSPAYVALVCSSSALVLLAVLVVMSGRLAPPEFVGLFLPVAALCVAVAMIGLKASTGTSAETAIATRDIAVFLVGVGAPTALFAGLYLATGGIGALIDGVLVAPQSRFEHASWSMPEPWTLLRALPVLAVFGIRFLVADRWRLLIDVVAGAAIAYLAVTAGDDFSYSVLWGTTRSLAPFVVVLGAVVLTRSGPTTSRMQRQTVGVIVMVAGFWTLVQFPFATPVYFCYAAPLLLLAAIACLHRFGGTAGILPAAVLIALVMFGVRQLDQQALSSLGVGYAPDPGVALIDADRASVRVPRDERDVYETVRGLVVRHSRGGTMIFAGPDAPEIYFLTDRNNGTPAILDFLDTSETTRDSRLLELLQHENVPMVVLNHAPRQSPPLSPRTINRIRALYDQSRHVGRFEVRWAHANLRHDS